MLKEIHEQPKAIIDTYRGRMLADQGIIRMSGIDDHINKFLNVRLIGCGTALNAAEIGQLLIEKLARIPAVTHIASEFRYNEPVINPNALHFVISQSGETADTLAALRKAKERGHIVEG